MRNQCDLKKSRIRIIDQVPNPLICDGDKYQTRQRCTFFIRFELKIKQHEKAECVPCVDKFKNGNG